VSLSNGLSNHRLRGNDKMGIIRTSQNGSRVKKVGPANGRI
jgi:hypothetical protein